MSPVHRQRVLRQIVRAYGKEIRLPGEDLRQDGRRRDFDHYPDRRRRDI
jgi:hypothetical protein